MLLLSRACTALLLAAPLTISVGGQAQSTVYAAPWDALTETAQRLRQDLANGDGMSAHICVLYMQMLIAGSLRASQVSDRLAALERKPIPEENDPSFSRFLPKVDELLQAIADADLPIVSKKLQNLNLALGEARVRRARKSGAAGALPSLYSLRGELEHWLHVNNAPRAVEVALELQGRIDDLVARHQWVQEYAFSHYMINDALGREAFLRHDYNGAAESLQKAAEIPAGADGTTRIDFFGPNTWLAERLLQIGMHDVVLKFLQTCNERFWIHDNEKSQTWIAEIQAGRPADLGANSAATYGYLESYR